MNKQLEMTSIPNPWVLPYSTNPSNKGCLFCLPPAGSGASVYRKLLSQHKEKSGLWADMDIFSVQLPGRENRLTEPLFTDYISLIDEMVPALLPHLQEPFFLFGHSMGALLAFELTRRLREFNKTPACLMVSAHRAPHLPNSKPKISQLHDAEFINEVQRLNGLPDAFMTSQDLIELALPALRADFHLCETYQYEDAAPLQCPIVVLGGTEDPYVSRTELESWQAHTDADFTIRLFQGGHFYLLNRHLAPVFKYLSTVLISD